MQKHIQLSEQTWNAKNKVKYKYNYCSLKRKVSTIDIEWAVYGDVTRVDILMSTEANFSEPVEIASNLNVSSSPFRYTIPNDLAPYEAYAIVIKDAQNENGAEAVTFFQLGATTITTNQVVTCNPAEVGEVAQTFTTPYRCDSTVVTQTILDNLPPVAICAPSYQVELDFEGTATLEASNLDNGSIDNCTIDRMELSKTNFSCEDVGTQTIIFRVFDAVGNSSECEVYLEVIDPFGGCDCDGENITINANPVLSGIYSSQNYISSNGRISNGDRVRFEAGQLIKLSAPFHAELGSDFSAVIKSCQFSTITPASEIEARKQNTSQENLMMKVIPNPFSSNTRIEFYLPNSSKVDLSVRTQTGQIIKTLNTPNVTKGWNQVVFYPDNLSTGIYLLTLKSEKEVITEKIVIME